MSPSAYFEFYQILLNFDSFAISYKAKIFIEIQSLTKIYHIFIIFPFNIADWLDPLKFSTKIVIKYKMSKILFPATARKKHTRSIHKYDNYVHDITTAKNEHAKLCIPFNEYATYYMQSRIKYLLAAKLKKKNKHQKQQQN